MPSFTFWTRYRAELLYDRHLAFWQELIRATVPPPLTPEEARKIRGASLVISFAIVALVAGLVCWLAP